MSLRLPKIYYWVLERKARLSRNVAFALWINAHILRYRDFLKKLSLCKGYNSFIEDWEWNPRKDHTISFNKRMKNSRNNFFLVYLILATNVDPSALLILLLYSRHWQLSVSVYYTLLLYHLSISDRVDNNFFKLEKLKVFLFFCESASQQKMLYWVE